MKILYFDCSSGASGDMIIGALLDAGMSIDTLRDELAKLKVEGYEIKKRKVKRSGITGTKFDVKIPSSPSGTKAHRRFHSFTRIINTIENSGLEKEVKELSKTVITTIAEAEAKVHGTKVDRVHFHEAGGLDLIIDVVGASIAFIQLGIEQTYCSPLVLGWGFVKSGHGMMPIPAPATMRLLRGKKVSFSDIPCRDLHGVGNQGIAHNIFDNAQSRQHRHPVFEQRTECSAEPGRGQLLYQGAENRQRETGFVDKISAFRCLSNDTKGDHA